MPLLKSPTKMALKKNIDTEMKDHPGRKDQNLAIAYSSQRAAKKKKMAQGGELSAKDEMKASPDEAMKRSMAMEMSKKPSLMQELDERDESMSRNSIDDAMDEREMKMRMMAKGGELDARDEGMEGIDHQYDMRDEDMLDSHPTMHKPERRAAESIHHDIDERDDMELAMERYAKGGMVDSIMKKRKMMADGGAVDLQDSNGDEHLNEEDQLSYDAARKKTYYDLSQMKDQPEDSNEHSDDIDSDTHDMVSMIRRKIRSR